MSLNDKISFSINCKKSEKKKNPLFVRWIESFSLQKPLAVNFSEFCK